MKKEDTIKNIVVKVERRDPINNIDVSTLLQEYVKDKKDITVDNQTFLILQQVFGIERMIESAVNYYKIKYEAVSLYNKDGSFIKTWF